MKSTSNHIQTLALIIALLTSHAYWACSQSVQGLIAHWPMQGGAADLAGNGHDGIAHGATLTADRFGTGDGAYRFDGNDFIAVPDSDALTLGASEFTISAWARVDLFGNDGGYYLMGHSSGPGDTSKWIFWIGTSGISFVTTATGWIGVGNHAFELHRWYQVAVRRSGNKIVAFVNGSPIGTNTISGTIPNPDAPLYIGTAEGGRPARPFRGAIDDVRIYKRALSDSEMLSLARFERHEPNLSIRVTQLALCWETQRNTWYQLQYRSALTTNQWIPLTGDWVVGDGVVHCTYDTVPVGGAQRFYLLSTRTTLPQ